MAVQMTFVKHPLIKQQFGSAHDGVVYIVSKSKFGWHAKMNCSKYGLRYENVSALVYDNRDQAEYACNLHANGGR